MVSEHILLDIYESLEGVISTHRVTVALRSVEELARYFASTPIIRIHLTRILLLALPGIDSNDLEKTIHTLNMFASVANFVPFHDLTDGNGDPNFAIQFTQDHLEYLQRKMYNNNDEDLQGFEVDDQLELDALKSSSAGFKIIMKTLSERLFILMENLPDPSKSTGIEKIWQMPYQNSCTLYLNHYLTIFSRNFVMISSSLSQIIHTTRLLM